jgi:hypothetical protein
MDTVSKNSLKTLNKITMKIKTGWLALAFFLSVSAVGPYYHWSNTKNSVNGTSVQKIEQTQNAFDVQGCVKVSIDKE